jgi:hypothetical protein
MAQNHHRTTSLAQTLDHAATTSTKTTTISATAMVSANLLYGDFSTEAHA